MNAGTLVTPHSSAAYETSAIAYTLIWSSPGCIHRYWSQFSFCSTQHNTGLTRAYRTLNLQFRWRARRTWVERLCIANTKVRGKRGWLEVRQSALWVSHVGENERLAYCVHELWKRLYAFRAHLDGLTTISSPLCTNGLPHLTSPPKKSTSASLLCRL